MVAVRATMNVAMAVTMRMAVDMGTRIVAAIEHQILAAVPAASFGAVMSTAAVVTRVMMAVIDPGRDRLHRMQMCHRAKRGETLVIGICRLDFLAIID